MLRQRIRKLREASLNLVADLLVIIIFIAIAGTVYDLGFDKTDELEGAFTHFYEFIFGAFLILYSWRFTIKLTSPLPLPARIYDLFIIAICLCIIDFGLLNMGLVAKWPQFGAILGSRTFMRGVIIVIFLVELSRSSLQIQRIRINPSLLFAGSFLVLILLGTGLLLLPRATTQGISLVDAFFTATSAVCVTGLIVVDTSSTFTPLGHWVLLMLIQMGGIGIMTFTSFFGFIFQGSASIRTELYLRDFINEESLGNIFKTLLKIVVFTFTIEAFGAALVYSFTDQELFESETQHIFYAAFHSVSAFCNAGFSTLEDGLHNPLVRYNYSLHLIIAIIIVVGGMGFPIVFNYYKYIKTILVNGLKRLLKKGTIVHTPRIININSKLVIATTLLLLAGGTAYFYLTEFDGALAGATGINKLISAFFAAVTPRTAGFNTIDMNMLPMPAILFTILLMWIGASPSSTGGGIKTSTFALSVLHVYALVRGKSKVELNKREVQAGSMQRANSILFLSLLVIGLSVFALSITEQDKFDLTKHLFETVSAFSTVGLSLGITGELSRAGKLVLIITMFVGRVGMLTLLIGVIRRARHGAYQYPGESILIN